mmetsp:Transcript_5392/g.12726  ORF Transcript_5392/g.12726 Transcript_5392/m.12726 type:complete len:201 (-) Transcript_5392:141-743(-)
MTDSSRAMLWSRFLVRLFLACSRFFSLLICFLVATSVVFGFAFGTGDFVVTTDFGFGVTTDFGFVVTTDFGFDLMGADTTFCGFAVCCALRCLFGLLLVVSSLSLESETRWVDTEGCFLLVEGREAGGCGCNLNAPAVSGSRLAVVAGAQGEAVGDTGWTTSKHSNEIVDDEVIISTSSSMPSIRNMSGWMSRSSSDAAG